MKFNRTVPVLYSADILRSFSYYLQKLGFKQKWEWGDPPTFGGVCKDEVEIYFCKNGQGNPGTWICLDVEDVDRYHETIKEQGAIILSPPQDMEWGIREMLVEDPDRHKIRFGQPIESD